MKTWEDCVAFHGHACGGLAIGYQAGVYASRLLGLTFSADEQVVCIAENDACSVDAVQVMLGCSIGKGNLLFHMRGKQAYSFYRRSDGRSVRLVLKPLPAGITKEQSLDWYLHSEPERLFDVCPVKIVLPERARLFGSCRCDGCGEMTGSNWIRLAGEKKLCLDCYEEYDRFHV